MITTVPTFYPNCAYPLDELLRPLHQLIQLGDVVLIKPNFVIDRHPRGLDIYSIITHPSLIRGVVDYVRQILCGTGRIIVADAPQYDCNWANLLNVTDLSRWLQGTTLLDLRPYWSPQKHFMSQRIPLSGDPLGDVLIDLEDKSRFVGLDPSNFYGARYERQETIVANTSYRVSKTVLSANVVILLPKLKTHKKVGVTLCLKNLVGIVTDKNTIPHYRLQVDQYPDNVLYSHERSLLKLERWMYDHLLGGVPWKEKLHHLIYNLHNNVTRKMGLKVREDVRALDAGNWYGNDTIWRAVLDLYDIIRYADENGYIRSTQQRRLFGLVDGIIGGEHNGPLDPDPVRAGVLIAGDDIMNVDLAALEIMGFDYTRVPLYRGAAYWDHHLKLCKSFVAPDGWKGHIER